MAAALIQIKRKRAWTAYRFAMNPDLRKFIFRILGQHRILTIATNRADGWPQATTVAYVNEGLTLYCFIARVSQKYANIKHDPRVSIAIAHDFNSPENIEGLSMAALAEYIDDKRVFDRILNLFLTRCPEFSSWGRPNPAFSPLVRLLPEIISVLDYSKSFGHSDLIKVSAADLRAEPIAI